MKLIGAFLQLFVANVAAQAGIGLNTPGWRGGGGEERGQFITETREKDNFTQWTALGYCVEHKVTPQEKFRTVYL
jgi:hypothetical protein